MNKKKKKKEFFIWIIKIGKLHRDNTKFTVPQPLIHCVTKLLFRNLPVHCV
jgi:hypothetical protein